VAATLPALSFAHTITSATASYFAGTANSTTTGTNIPGSITAVVNGLDPIISSSASASVTGGPVPTVSFGSSQGGAGEIGDDAWGPSGQAVLTYYMKAPSASGSTGTVTIDMYSNASNDATASGTLTSNAYANSEANLIISTGGNNQLVNYFSQSEDCDPIAGYNCSGASNVSTFQRMTRLSVLSGTSVEIYMLVGGPANVTGTGGIPGSVFSDRSLDTRCVELLTGVQRRDR
jgi:hypothetical protein